MAEQQQRTQNNHNSDGDGTITVPSGGIIASNDDNLEQHELKALNEAAEDVPRPRSKFRLTAVLAALYVGAS